MKISQLKTKSNNPRKIDQPQIEKLMQSIKDFPAMMELRPIVYDPITMEVLGGNQRLTACKKLGMKELPDAWVRSADSLTEDEKRRFVIQDNHQSGEWDFDLLSSDWADIDLGELGIVLPEFDDKQLNAQDDDFESPDDVQTVQTDIKRGDIIEIGKHRLMCGDSTSEADVALLINGQKADMVLTDPPYGINVPSDNSKRGKNTSLMKGGLNLIPFTDDSTKYAIEAYNIIKKMKIPIHVWWGANYYCHALPETGNWLVWDKRVEDKMTNTNSDGEVAWVLDGHNSVRIYRHLWNGLLKESEKSEKRIHPTQKPIALMEWCITKYANSAQCIIDLFLGSGTTMVACHQLDRICYGMEISPQYCQVVVDRMRKLDANISIKINGKEYNG